jgi:hypothetical protein
MGPATRWPVATEAQRKLTGDLHLFERNVKDVAVGVVDGQLGHAGSKDKPGPGEGGLDAACSASLAEPVGGQAHGEELVEAPVEFEDAVEEREGEGHVVEVPCRG